MDIDRLLKMGVVSRVAFYPTLVYNLFLEKVTSRNWYDHIDDRVILGALPFKSMTKQLVESERVVGVVTTNEPYETEFWCNSSEDWERVGVQHLVIPIQDLISAPSLDQLRRSVDFIRSFTSSSGKIYVHCKAGRTRSTTVVAAYLMEANKWNPQEALDFIKQRRPHVWLREPQMTILEQFGKEIESRRPKTDN